MAQKLSAKEAAAEIGTDARTLRKFLRTKTSGFEAVGQGKRYEFTKAEVKTMKKAFLAWGAGSTKKGDDPKDILNLEPVDKEVDEVPEEVDLDSEDEPVDLDDLEGPDDEELEDIEIEDLED